MAVDPEMGKVNKGARHKERAMSVDQWNPTKRLTYDINSLPQRESRSRRQMTSGYGTGYRPDSSDDDRNRHRHRSEARRSPSKAQHSHGSVTDRRWRSTAQHGSYRQGKEEAKPSHSGLPRESSPDHSQSAERQSRRQRRLKDSEKFDAGRGPGRSTSDSTDRDRQPSTRNRRRRDTSPSSSDNSSSDRRMPVTAAASQHRQKLKLRTFDGTGSFETFWAHSVTCAEYNRWRTVDQLAHLKAALTDDAGQVLWDTDPVAIDSLSKLTTLLRSRFSGSRQADKCKMDLKLRRRKPGESLTSLH